MKRAGVFAIAAIAPLALGAVALALEACSSDNFATADSGPEGGDVTVDVVNDAKDDRPGPTEIRMPGYTLLDVIAGVSLTKAFDLNVTLRNLLDRTYPVSPDSRAVAAPGLHGVLTLTARF